MHFLVSYIGSIGFLITGTRMQEVLEQVFGTAPTMLTAKKYPQYVRALPLLVEELLCSIL